MYDCNNHCNYVRICEFDFHTLKIKYQPSFDIDFCEEHRKKKHTEIPLIINYSFGCQYLLLLLLLCYAFFQIFSYDDHSSDMLCNIVIRKKRQYRITQGHGNNKPSPII